MKCSIRRIVVNFVYIQAICLGFIGLLFSNYAPSVMGLFSVMKYAGALSLIVIYRNHFQQSKAVRNVLLVFLLYSLFVCFYYLFPKIALSRMLIVPQSLSALLIQSLYIGILMIYVDKAAKEFNLKAFLYSFVFLTVFPCVGYVRYVGFDSFQRMGYDSSVVVIASLTIGYMASNVLLVSTLLRDSFSRNRVLNTAIWGLVTVSCVYVIMAGGKRGPILWLFVSFLVYNFFATKKIYKSLLKIGFVFLILYVTGPYILDFFRDYSPFSVGRIEDAIYGGDTSNRLDDSNSCYYIAWNLILDHPVLGSYFRLLAPGTIWNGMYPHNIFLEVAITCGLVGLIPFSIVLYRTFSRIKRICVMYKNEMFTFCFLMFLSTFTSLQTTGTLLVNAPFWVLLALVNSNLFNRNLVE